MTSLGGFAFLKAATRQINEHGYRGASVDRISASLNVTKGAFYHHNEAKDDLVAADDSHDDPDREPIKPPPTFDERGRARVG